MISDFQFVLIGVIAVVIVGVIVYNRWQESKYRRRAEQAFAHGPTAGVDALFANLGGTGGRVEPSFGQVEAGRDADDQAQDELTAPIGANETGPVGPANELAPAVNAEIDTIAMILADAPVEADRYAPMIAQ